MAPSAKLGFNGEAHEPETRWQLLGNGYRAYNPVLMRFHSPDPFSPFAIGGRNAYTYCHGDPVNSTDPSGRFAIPLMLGLTGIVGGAVPLITSSQPESGGDEGGISPWMIGAIVVGVAALGIGVLGAGRHVAQGNSQGIKPLLPEGFRLKPKASRSGSRPKPLGHVNSNELPPPFEDTAKAVKAGGGFNFPNHDGEVFHNVDGVLPSQPHGYYRSYTMQYRRVIKQEPGNRGTMRLIAGGNNPVDPDIWYYSEYHYRDLKQVHWRLRNGEYGNKPGHF